MPAWRWWIGVLPLALGVFGIATSMGGGAGSDAGAQDAGVVRGTVVDAGPPSPSPPCPEGMVLIPAGRFRMGSAPGVGNDDEHPQHEVTVDAFCIDRTEVTVAAFRACREVGGCPTDPNAYAATRGSYNNFCNWGRPGSERHPVNCLDWNQARTYCQWSGHAGGARRLPTEAEWEYAARGFAGRTYAWGDTLEAGRANFCGGECVAGARALGLTFSAFPNWTDAFAFTAPVGSSPTGYTPEGVADLTGNVWEWVEDVYDPRAYTAHGGGFNARVALTRVPAGATESRVVRGGGWVNVGPHWVRAAFRRWFAPTVRYGGMGVRCARGVTR